MPSHYLPPLSDAGARWARFLAIVATIALGLYVCWTIRSILAPLAGAWALAYILNPLINRLAQRGIGRLPSVSVCVAIFAILLFGLGTLSLLQFINLAGRVPDYLKNVCKWLDDNHADWFGDSDSQSQLVGLAQAHGKEIGALLLSHASVWIGNITHWLSLFVLLPLYLFFLLLNYNAIVSWFKDHLPHPSREAVLDVLNTADAAVSGFFRGRVIICAAMGLLCGVGWMVVGVPNSLLLGLAVGVTSLVPFGSLTVLPIALLLAYSHLPPDHDWKIPVILTFGVYLAVHALESFVLAPLVLAHTSGLHPVTIIVSLLIGHRLFGVLGLLLAIPTASTLITLGLRYLIPEVRRLALPPRDPPIAP